MRMSLFIISVSLVLISCGAKKKTVEKSISESKSESLDSTSVSSTFDVISESDFNSIILKSSKLLDIELTQGIPENEISIIGSNGEKSTIKGANIKISYKQESENKSENFSEKSEVKIKLDSLTSKSDLNSSTDLIDFKSVDIDRSNNLFLILSIIVVAAYLLRSYFRKSLNPFKW